MRRRRLAVSAALVAIVGLALTACDLGGSGGGQERHPHRGSHRGTSRPSKTRVKPALKIGILTDATGPASSAFTTNEKGIQAYLNGVNDTIDGQKIEYVTADTTSTPTGALSAAQKLVEHDHVVAIIENSSIFYGAEPFLLQQGVPVIGSAIDGPIWSDSKNTNLFPAAGVTNSEYVQLAQGQFMKAQGVTKCGAIGYANSLSAKNSAIGFVKSCQAAGLQATYLNTQLYLGTTDVGPIALAIKNSGTDGLALPVSPSTAFALVGALHQLGVKLKSILLSTGYGGDLLASRPAVQAAQGLDFMTIGNPAEAKTPATRKRAADLRTVGVTGPPTFAEQEAYLSMTLLAAGLKAAGPHPSQDDLMKALRGLKNYDADGLLAPEKIDFSNWTPATSCLWAAELRGSTFLPVKGTPICGALKKFVSD